MIRGVLASSIRRYTPPETSVILHAAAMPTTSISEDFAELKDIPTMMHNPEEDIITQQEYDKWLANIEKLKDDYCIVAKMNLIDNFGYKEIAEALDMPINTVKTKIRRAKAMLLKMMDYSDEIL